MVRSSNYIEIRALQVFELKYNLTIVISENYISVRSLVSVLRRRSQIDPPTPPQYPKDVAPNRVKS